MIATVTFVTACKIVGAMGAALLVFAWLVSLSERKPDPQPDPEPFPYEHRAYGRRPTEAPRGTLVDDPAFQAWKKAA